MILYIDVSPIDGQGVFTSIDLPDGYVFGPICEVSGYGKYFMRLDRNIIGKYINHADEPNCELFFDVGGLWVRLREDIKNKEELTLNYLGENNWTQDLLNAEAERMNKFLFIF
jgi:hypothetical protein